ncbi:unnamed protein product [Moneuplotes crassus]|uniref:Uncharacterized protein n=1 Tax=Euplotes crassus TaxID=5936 RepID=A0AAD1Y842_EUPCR|nr:unnamed protein product [Moneuplotes crassus]
MTQIYPIVKKNIPVKSQGSEENYCEKLKKKYELYTIETGGSKCLFFNQPCSGQKEEYVFEHSGFQITPCAPVNTSSASQKFFPSSKGSISQGNEEEIQLRGKYTSQDVISPDSRTNFLYNASSSLTNAHFYEENQNNHQGEPIDLSLGSSGKYYISQEAQTEKVTEPSKEIKDTSEHKAVLEDSPIQNIKIKDILPKEDSKPTNSMTSMTSRNIIKRVKTEKIIDCILQSEGSPRSRLPSTTQTQSLQTSTFGDVDLNKRDSDRLKSSSSSNNLLKSGVWTIRDENIPCVNDKASPISMLQQRRITANNTARLKLNFSGADLRSSGLKENIQSSWNEVTFQNTKNHGDSCVKISCQDSDYFPSDTTDYERKRVINYQKEKYRSTSRSKSRERIMKKSFAQSLLNVQSVRSFIPIRPEREQAIYKSQRAKQMAKTASAVSFTEKFGNKPTLPSKATTKSRNGSLRDEFETLHKTFKKIVGKRTKSRKKSKSKRRSKKSKSTRSCKSRKKPKNQESSTALSSALIQGALKNLRKYQEPEKKKKQRSEIYLI